MPIRLPRVWNFREGSMCFSRVSRFHHSIDLEATWKINVVTLRTVARSIEEDIEEGRPL